MNQILIRLKNEGWYVNELKLTNYIRDVDLNLNYTDVKNYLLNTDIKHYGESWINTSNKSEFQCVGVLQINKIRNVAAPEIDQDSKANTPLFKYTITDGVSTVFLLDLQSNPKLNRNTEPGCKVIFNGNALFKSGMVILYDKIGVSCLGGKVLDLIKSESAQKASKKPNRNAITGPPRFTPFGNKLNINVQEIRQFKALQIDPLKDHAEVDNTDFGDKREAALAEIRKSKQGDTTVMSNKNTLLDKFHGGGTSKFVKETAEKQDQKDSNVAYLMSSGFNFTEVQRALKANNNDVNVALDQLLQKRTNSHKDPSEKEFRGRGKKGRGRGRNNDDEDDSWFDPAQYAAKVGLASRPNTTISLAELMGTKPTLETKYDNQASHFNSNMIGRGYHCLAEVMDGSYQAAVVVDVLPNKCLTIRYLNSGEIIDTSVVSLKMVTGEKILEHMVPNVPERQQQQQQSEYKSANHYENYRGRGRGHPSRRRGGRYHRGY